MESISDMVDYTFTSNPADANGTKQVFCTCRASQDSAHSCGRGSILRDEREHLLVQGHNPPDSAAAQSTSFMSL
jgi:hypothetical protein